MMNDIFDTVAGFLTDPVIKIPNRRFIPDCLTQVVQEEIYLTWDVKQIILSEGQ